MNLAKIYCCFCGKHDQDDVVRALVGGNSRHICDRCITLCIETIMKDSNITTVEEVITDLRTAVICGMERIKLTKAQKELADAKEPPQTPEATSQPHRDGGTVPGA